MTFRSRLLAGFAVATVLPLSLLAFGVRREVTQRLGAEFAQRLRTQSDLVAGDLVHEAGAIALRLATLTRAMAADDRFRQGAVRGEPGARAYVLDYATHAMNVAGLSMLQVQDDAGRILSSGHFRQEYDRLEPELPRLVAPGGGAVIVRARTADGSFLALARADSVRMAGRWFFVVGGTRIDDGFLGRFARDARMSLRLDAGGAMVRAGDPAPPANVVEDTLALRFAETDGEPRLTPARLVLSQSLDELVSMRRDVNRWFLAALGAVAMAAVALAWWLSLRFSRPLAELAQATALISLGGGDIELATGRSDEVGTLARRLASLATRLRASAAQVREAERRATVGEMARQVNHDIKNGLIPIRNVLRHLGEVGEHAPASLPAAFAERRATLDASVAYLDSLSRNYARLTPRIDRRPLDVNAIVDDAAQSARAGAVSAIETRLAPALPAVTGDPVLVRRVVDNLLRNAIESLTGAGGSVRVTTANDNNGGVTIAIADTGGGMTEDQLARAFDDFFTTKPDGSGLGLSVVRRLAADLGGDVRAESAPGRGTTVIVTLPAAH